MTETKELHHRGPPAASCAAAQAVPDGGPGGPASQRSRGERKNSSPAGRLRRSNG